MYALCSQSSEFDVHDVSSDDDESVDNKVMCVGV